MATELDYMEYSTDALAQAAYVTNGHHPIVFNDNAQLDTALQKFGTASLLLDGTDDFLTSGDSTTFKWLHGAENTTDFKVTIDFWLRLPTPEPDTFYSLVTTCMATTTDIGLVLLFDDRSAQGYSRRLRLMIFRGVGTTYVVNLLSDDNAYPDDSDWHHIEVCHDQTPANDNARLFVDGVLKKTVDKSADAPSAANSSDNLHIGSLGDGTFELPGSMDELRISSVVRHTANFNAPTVPHQTDTNTKLLLHFDGADEATATVDWSRLESRSESTIKEQGSYSLEGFAKGTDSLNDTLTNTLGAAVDLSGIGEIKYGIYSDRTGSNIKIGIHDSGGTTSEHTANISSADAWETQTWNLSAISNANRDDIDSIIITIVNADADNTFYIDNFLGQSFQISVHDCTDIDEKLN